MRQQAAYSPPMFTIHPIFLHPLSLFLLCVMGWLIGYAISKAISYVRAALARFSAHMEEERRLGLDSSDCEYSD